ncbi:ArdC-like ssDNA-binding domain-containing protein [Halobacillus litoralis]|uniref:LtrC n=1 Tax=Halobacillus litoralis TaxID=45668 RepID=A0A410MJE6_9BACI|nr:ArdC-like ssDNA-binding domain-containing protein [Halobacillus litoralis]QAS54857.1 LtrC [Halobacillus litoralis]
MKKNGWKKKKGYPTQKERVEELIETLEKGVHNFEYSPDQFKALLRMKAIMPKYSFRNLMVAKSQLPNASCIAGYKHWQTLGRQVKKGQTSLRIFKPKIAKVKEEYGEEEDKLVGWVTVPVFDYSQTEGDPLPIDEIKITLDGDCMEAREVISLAEKVAEKDGCPITYGDSGSACGFYNITEHSITVGEHLSINHRCKTLVHELVHSKVDRYNRDTTAKEREVVAEGTAFVICSYFNLDTSDYSFQYVKSWSKGDDEALLKYGSKICNTAKAIIDEFEDLRDHDTKIEGSKNRSA